MPILEWDDFTGGYYVGRSDMQQPADTWRGKNCFTDPWDGMLAPTGAFTTLTNSGTPTAQYAQSNAFLFRNFGGNVYRVYLTTTANLINCCRYVVVSDTATVTNTTLTTTGSVLWSAVAWDTDYIFASYLPSAGANTLARIHTTSLAVNTYTGPASETTGMRCLTRWGEFMVGAGFATGYRLWFSNAYDPTTWGASDYYDIGDSSAITAIVPIGDTLYVAKPEGWYAVTGVLGATASIRRIAPGVQGPSYGYAGGTTYSAVNGMGAIETPYGIMFPTGQLTAVALNGNVMTPVNFQRPNGIPQMVMPGLYAWGGGGDGAGRQTTDFVSSSKTVAWLLETNFGRPRWMRFEIPYTTTDTGQGNFAQVMPGTNLNQASRPLYVDNGVTLGRLNFTGDAGTATGVVHLAEKRETQPFVIKDVFVEIAWAAGGTVPTVSTQLELRGWPDLGVPSRVATTAMTETIGAIGSAPTSALYFDRPYVHQTLRYSADGAASTAVVPIITFSGCRIRRVWCTTALAGRA